MYFADTLYVLSILVSYAPQVRNEKVNSYEGAQVWQTSLRGSTDILLIKKLVDAEDISIWNFTPKRADFLVRSNDKLKINRILSSEGLNHTVVVLDVQRRIDAQYNEPVLWDDNTLSIGHRLNWKEYPTLEIIEEYFDYLIENFPSICKVSTIGYTAENRTIKMIKISNGNPENKIIMITAGLNAREWISITSALYILDSVISKLIIPLLNPDGFKYSHTHDRLWRKNRRELSDCSGVDVNRNFAIDWDIPQISVPDECSERYSGPKPFSEAESIVLRDVVNKSGTKMKAFIDLHTYGQFILYPWSGRPGAINDKYAHRQNAEQMAETIYNSTGQKYKPGESYHTIYPATGTAIDWVYSTGVPTSFAIKSGDDGLYGFLLPPEHIESTGKETLVALRELARAIDSDFSRRGREGPWF